jgi:hypothetical protein
VTRKRIWICVNRLDDPRGNVWLVRYGNRWMTTKRIDVQIPTETIFRGRRSPQPKAYLAGYGVARRERGIVMVTYA